MIIIAYTKIWNITNNLGQVINYSKNGKKTKKEQDNTQDLRQAINYAMNSDKTEQQYYVSGINCEVDSAFYEMKNAQEFYDKTTGNVGFHAVQSFKERRSYSRACS